MKLYVQDCLIPNEFDANNLRASADFRRSTYAIAQGAWGIRELLARNAWLRALVETNEVGIIVGTSVGEIETTRDFLRELATKETARPFLFQLSSHNSTLGFLTQYFKLRGPALTLSNQYQTAECSLESAYLALHAQTCRAVIIYCCDFGIAGWIDRKIYDENPHLKEGRGAALLVVTNDAKVESGRPPVATIENLSFGQSVEASALDRDFFDSNTLSLIAADIGARNYGAKAFPRPDGTLTNFFLGSHVG